MSKDKEKTKEKSGKFINFLLTFFMLIAFFCSGFAIYEIFLLSGIESLIRYIVMGVLALIDLFIFFKVRRYKKGKKKGKKKQRKGLFIFFLLLYSIITFGIGGAIFYIYGKLDSLNKGTITYTSNLLVMSSNEAQEISDIEDMTIGILGDKKSPEGYIIPHEIIKEHNLNDTNEFEDYDDYTTMLVDLYEGTIDAMFVSGSYVSMFSGITGYENIESDTRVIISKDKKMKKSLTSKIETASSGKAITEPFTILLMGIDSTDEVLTKNAIANGDTLILVTFNPKTLNATMLSIPRDSYVPIACWSGQPENKITHAAAYGNDCMINTIQNYFDVNIDYYAKINFKGLVKLVDAVGGVEADVEQTLCTDDSNRGGEVCIKPGKQVLNGEQALVYARNRKALANGDFGRAEHQQEIVMALINKVKEIKDVSKFMDILNTVSNSMDTNLTTKQILSFYNVGKDIIKKSLSSPDADLINIQRLYLQGSGAMIYDERARMVLWDYIPNKNSKKDIIRAMKVNLEQEKHENITEFHFSINKPYKKKVIGEGPYSGGTSYTLVPNFIGLTADQARSLAKRYGVSVTFIGTEGTVVSQSEPANRRTDLIKGSITLTLSSKENEDQDKIDKEKEKEKEKEKDKEKEKEKEKEEDDDEEEVDPTPSPSPSDSPSSGPSDDPNPTPDQPNE